MDETKASDTAFPLSIVLERRVRSRDRWQVVDWRAVGVLTDPEHLRKNRERQIIHEDEESMRVLWTGFIIRLVKDGGASYWANLMAEQPSLFVVCRCDESDEEPQPFLVTVNYDEIIGYQEVDDEVYRFALPPAIYQWLERYVVNHYVPEPVKSANATIGVNRAMTRRDPDGDYTDAGFLRRWSRRKSDVDAASPSARDPLPGAEAADAPGEINGPHTGVGPDPVEPEPIKTDADMPDLDSLTDSSDVSDFLSPGVSETLRNQALRRLFRTPRFNVVDALDDYNEDFRNFAALGDIVTSDMRHRAWMDEQRRHEEAERIATQTSETDDDAPGDADQGDTNQEAHDEEPETAATASRDDDGADSATPEPSGERGRRT